MVCSALAVVVQLGGPWTVHTRHPGPRPLRSAAVLRGQLKKGPLARGPWQPALPLWILDWETGPGMASIVAPSVSPTPVITKISLRSWRLAPQLARGRYFNGGRLRHFNTRESLIPWRIGWRGQGTLGKSPKQSLRPAGVLMGPGVLGTWPLAGSCSLKGISFSWS